MDQFVTLTPNSKQVYPGCPVFVSLSNNTAGGQRISVNAQITLGDLGLGAGVGVAKPDFSDSQNQINAVTANPALSAQQKSAAISEILQAFDAKNAEFKEVAGGDINDQVAVALIPWLVANHGFSTSDVKNKPVIKPDQIAVASYMMDSGSLAFHVTGTAVWG